MQLLTNEQSKIIKKINDELFNKNQENKKILEDTYCAVLNKYLYKYNENLLFLIEDYIDSFYVDNNDSYNVSKKLLNNYFKAKISFIENNIESIKIEKIANKVMDILDKNNTITKRKFIYNNEQIFRTCHVNDSLCFEMFCCVKSNTLDLILYPVSKIKNKVSIFENMVYQSNSYFNTYECIEAILKNHSAIMSINDFEIDDNGVCTYTQNEESLKFLRENF